MALLVNGEYIDDQTIRTERNLLRKQLAEKLPGEDALTIEDKAREWAVENVIERVLLRQAARQLLVDADEKQQMEKLVETVTGGIPRPPRREVSDYYRKHQELFRAPERAHASHIVKNVDEAVSEDAARSAMEAIQAQLEQGKTFAEAADECSDCPGRGGDLGWFARGEMVEEFDTAVFALRPGEMSGIIRSPFGFHLAQLHARKATGMQALPEVYPQIEAWLVEKARTAKMEGYVDDLRAQAEIRQVTARA